MNYARRLNFPRDFRLQILTLDALFKFLDNSVWEAENTETWV